MDTMLGGFDFTFAYLDDIVISSKTKELHKEHLHKVFAQIREFGFKVKEAKCDFCMNKIKYLGHIIDKDERRPDLERATAIKDMPTPYITELPWTCKLLPKFHKKIARSPHPAKRTTKKR